MVTLVITLTLSFSATLDEAEIEYQKSNFDKAFSLFEKLSIQGNSMAQQRFGTMYYMGRRVKKDYEKSAFSDSPECYHDWRKDSYQVSAAVDSNLIKKFRTVDRYFNNMYITELEIRPKSKEEANNIINNQISIRINSATITKIFNARKFDFGFKDVDVEIVDKVTGKKVENLTAVLKYMDENRQLISKNIVQ